MKQHFSDFLPSGQLQTGANYWASHAGIFMWRDWQPETIDRDFKLLAQSGLTLLRVFPLWPDFQPIHCLRRDNFIPVEFRHGEVPLGTDSIGQSGVSPVMLDRFQVMSDLAEKHGLGLIVGLITGWMSGRSLVPPGLEGLNPITNPLSILWQTRFVKVMVERFQEHPAIRAWDLGNECNCLGPASREEAWVWTSTLAGAIRGIDPTHPIVSGMHGLSVEPTKPWSIADQGELTDVLTTHPYPLFTAHCNREPMNTIRPLLHATAETRLYGDLSGKTSMAEEMGNFGPAFCGEKVACDIIRANLMSLWAHDARAMLWWCAHDQTELEFPPYDWISMERELGLFRTNGSAKPVVEEIQKVTETLGRLPISHLPSRRIDAVCILSSGQDQWGAAYSSFILAKQAGFDIRFHYGSASLPQAELYLLPSIKGLSPLTRQQELDLKLKVEAGATAYVSVDDGFLNEVMKMNGLELILRNNRPKPCKFRLLPGTAGEENFELCGSTQFQLNPGSARILATEENGMPVFSEADCGLGKMYFLSLPLETSLAAENGAFHPEGNQPFWKIYQLLAANVLSSRAIHKTSPHLGITEHALEDGSLVAVLINYHPGILKDALSLSPVYTRIESWLGDPIVLSGNTCNISLPPNGTAILHLQK